ncbi:MAG: hypothetical protein JXM68_14035 [Sedimentisphaerales bacterium]|nr:hypothetical protein [Sedimentisphaerales bacterium]
MTLLILNELVGDIISWHGRASVSLASFDFTTGGMYPLHSIAIILPDILQCQKIMSPTMN